MKKALKVVGIGLFVVLFLVFALADYDFAGVGHAVGHLVGTAIKFAIPVGVIVFIVWLIKRGKKK